MTIRPMRILISVPKAGGHLFAQMTESQEAAFLVRDQRGPGQQFMAAQQIRDRLRGMSGNVWGHVPYHPALAPVVESAETALLLVRDPRDIIVSHAHYVARKRNSALDYAIGKVRLSKIPFEQRVGFLIASMGPVFARFDMWRRMPFVQVFRYEEYQRDPEGTMERLGALGYGAVDGMRARAKIHSYTFRKGAIGDWETEFTGRQKAKAERLFGEIIDRWGQA